jgi:hypothetical protein
MAYIMNNNFQTSSMLKLTLLENAANLDTQVTGICTVWHLHQATWKVKERYALETLARGINNGNRSSKNCPLIMFIC